LLITDPGREDDLLEPELRPVTTGLHQQLDGWRASFRPT